MTKVRSIARETLPLLLLRGSPYLVQAECLHSEFFEGTVWYPRHPDRKARKTSIPSHPICHRLILPGIQQRGSRRIPSLLGLSPAVCGRGGEGHSGRRFYERYPLPALPTSVMG